MKTRILLMIVMLVFIGLSGKAQTPNWTWARNANGTNGEEGWSVATDPSGNVYITGFFYGSTISFGAFTLTNAGQTYGDIFLVKYNSSGSVLWAKSGGGIYDDASYGVATDASGNVFISGYFSSPTITFGAFTLSNSIGGGIFIVKYDANGNELWAKSASDSSAGRCFSVATDASGNILLTGGFQSNSITFDTITLTNTGGLDIFIVKYDANGNVLWAKSAGSADDEQGFSVATDSSGNVFITGYFFSPTITFGTYTLTNVSIGYRDIFIVKYDPTGTVLWAKSAGGTSNDGSFGLATDISGNVFVTGYFQSDSIIFGTFILTDVSNFDIFIVKYDATGNVLWAKSAGGTSVDEGYSLATDASGNVYMTGGFTSSSIAFDSDTLFYPSIGGDPMFLVKYNPTGSVLWAKELASGGDDQNAVATDAFGHVFVVGDFYVTHFIVGLDTLLMTGGENVFIAKLNATTGIEEISTQQTLLLFPNPFPTQTILTIQGTYHNPSLFIYNLLGQVVRSISVGTNNQLTIQRNQLTPGMYFYKLIEDNKEVLGIGKMMVE